MNECPTRYLDATLDGRGKGTRGVSSFAYLIPSILFLLFFSSLLFHSSFLTFRPCSPIISFPFTSFAHHSASVVSSNWTRPSQVPVQPIPPPPPPAKPSQPNKPRFFFPCPPRSSFPVPINSLRKIAPIAPAEFPKPAPSDSHMFHLHSVGATRDDRHP
ncbi:hypothetical protein EDB80DRAFT_710072 [Ilyonectria destructans]|nr:hypothetical protein EDB80DRAFT_710072 [Ilyonectria destructans]